MTAEELQAIRARVDERCDAIATTQDPGLRGFFAITDIRALLAHVDALRRERDELQERLHGVIDGNKHCAISARIAIHRLLDGAEVEQHADYHVRIAALIADRDKTVAELRSALAHVDAFGISYDRTQCPNCGLVWPNPTPPATRARRTR
jgi:hypothetical protein